MGRVTTTAGVPVAGCAADGVAAAARGPDAGCVVETDFMDPDPGCAGDVPLFDGGGCAAGIPRCVGLDAAGAPF
jgi:hypothetical protein